MIPRSPYVAGSVWLLLGIVVVCLGLLMIEEGVLYITHKLVITPYVRTEVGHHVFVFGLIAVALVALVSAAVTHFWLDR